MKRYLEFSFFTIIWFAIISLSFTQRSKQTEFCSDSQEVDTMFSMSETTYSRKGDLFYTKSVEVIDKFAGKMSRNARDIFKMGNNSFD